MNCLNLFWDFKSKGRLCGFFFLCQFFHVHSQVFCYQKIKKNKNPHPLLSVWFNHRGEEGRSCVRCEGGKRGKGRINLSVTCCFDAVRCWCVSITTLIAENVNAGVESHKNTDKEREENGFQPGSSVSVISRTSRATEMCVSVCLVGICTGEQPGKHTGLKGVRR